MGNGTDPQRLFDFALGCRDRGDFDTALDLLTPAAESGHAAANAELGRLLLFVDDFYIDNPWDDEPGPAERYLRRAVTTGAASGRAQILLASVLMRQLDMMYLEPSPGGMDWAAGDSAGGLEPEEIDALWCGAILRREDEVAALLGSVLRADPGDPAAQDLLVTAYDGAVGWRAEPVYDVAVPDLPADLTLTVPPAKKKRYGWYSCEFARMANRNGDMAFDVHITTDTAELRWAVNNLLARYAPGRMWSNEPGVAEHLRLRVHRGSQTVRLIELRPLLNATGTALDWSSVAVPKLRGAALPLGHTAFDPVLPLPVCHFGRNSDMF